MLAAMTALLPGDHALRRPVPGDAEAVLRVMLARDVEDIGYPDFTLEDLRADWATPGLDLEHDGWVAEGPGGEIVASALVLGDDALVYVHPDACGRGLGSALRELAEERARERGTAVLRQFVPVGERARRAAAARRGLLARAALPPHARSTSTAPCRRPTARYARSSATTTRSRSTSSSSPRSARSRATSPSRWRYGGASGSRSRAGTRRCGCSCTTTEGLVGAGLGERWEGDVGYVAQLGVAPRARGKGYGRALLLALFEAFRSTGLRAAELSVHGANRGAAHLYESVGMRASWEAQRWEKALGHA